MEDYQVLLWLDHPESGSSVSQELPLTVQDVNKQHFDTRDLLGKCQTAKYLRFNDFLCKNTTMYVVFSNKFLENDLYRTFFYVREDFKKKKE